MHSTVKFNGKLPLVGKNDKGQKTRFDATLDESFPAKYASPMEVVLESFAACSMMDIIIILKKMKKEIVNLETGLEAERAEVHPKVFTSINARYRLKSPDCTLDEFNKAITLSIDKYCSVAAILRGSGCTIAWSSELS
ncbi:MAG TPA: OsmC family protein [Chlorobaculum sp.]|nr:OsmC family protein [Chlorobaculum sp.]